MNFKIFERIGAQSKLKSSYYYDDDDDDDDDDDIIFTEMFWMVLKDG